MAVLERGNGSMAYSSVRCLVAPALRAAQRLGLRARAAATLGLGDVVGVHPIATGANRALVGARGSDEAGVLVRAEGAVRVALAAISHVKGSLRGSVGDVGKEDPGVGPSDTQQQSCVEREIVAWRKGH